MTKFLIMLLNVSMPALSVGIYYTDQFISQDLSNNIEEVTAEDDSILQYQQAEKLEEHKQTHKEQHEKSESLATKIKSITFKSIDIDQDKNKTQTTPTTKSVNTIVNSAKTTKDVKAIIAEKNAAIETHKKQTDDLKQLFEDTKKIISESDKYSAYFDEDSLSKEFIQTIEDLKTKISKYKDSIKTQIRSSTIPKDVFSACKKREINVQYSYVERLSRNLENVLKVAKKESVSAVAETFEWTDVENRRCKNWRKFNKK